MVRSVSERSWPQFLRKERSKLGRRHRSSVALSVCAGSALLTNDQGHTALGDDGCEISPPLPGSVSMSPVYPWLSEMLAPFLFRARCPHRKPPPSAEAGGTAGTGEWGVLIPKPLEKNHQDLPRLPG